MKWLHLLCALVLLPLVSGAQLRIEEGIDPQRFVEEVFKGQGVTVSNVKYTGHRVALGRFEDPDHVLGMPQGLLLTTGNCASAAGPNSTNNKSTDLRMPGDRMLQFLSRGRSYDAAVLEFDFVPEQDSIHFLYLFASEEYTEYVGSEFNDVFGFWISGPGYKTATNIARIPGGDPVTVNTVNHRRNRNLYVDNNCWTPHGQLKTAQSRTLDPVLLSTLEYDGITTFLRARARVYAGQTYHIKIAIADVSDGMFDSAVFLEGKSFKSAPWTPEELLTRESRLIPLSVKLPKPADTLAAAGTPAPGGMGSMLAARDSARVLHFAFDATAWQAGDSADAMLNATLHLLQQKPALKVTLLGYTDSVGDTVYNARLSEARCAAVRDWFLAQGIAADRILLEPHGEQFPLQSNETAQGRAANRRVQLVVWK